MLRLRPYTLGDEAQALAAHDALRADDFSFLLRDPDRSWPDFVQDQREHRYARGLPGDWPPGSQLAAVDGNVLVGRVSLRYALTNSFVAEHAGHVGYAVLPAWRRRGYATAMLGQALILLRAEGVDRVLVTCSPDNVGSRRVIESHGGRFERVADALDGEGPVLRFWID